MTAADCYPPDPHEAIRELDMLVRIRQLTRRDQFKLNELVNELLVQQGTASRTRQHSQAIITKRQGRVARAAWQAELQADIDAARKWARDMGKVSRRPRGERVK